MLHASFTLARPFLMVIPTLWPWVPLLFWNWKEMNKEGILFDKMISNSSILGWYIYDQYFFSKRRNCQRWNYILCLIVCHKREDRLKVVGGAPLAISDSILKRRGMYGLLLTIEGQDCCVHSCQNWLWRVIRAEVWQSKGLLRSFEGG